jgi:hypothetical protein
VQDRQARTFLVRMRGDNPVRAFFIPWLVGGQTILLQRRLLGV